MNNHEISVRRRMARAAEMIRSGAYGPGVRKLAGMILNGPASRLNSSPGDPFDVIRPVFRWVKDNIKYVRDPRGYDAFFPADTTISIRIGDCDDQTIALGAVLMHLGFPVKIRAVSFDGKKFDHVYPLVGANLRDKGYVYIPLDTVYGNIPGRSPKHAKRIEVMV